jgi:adenylate kinase family enzyme
LISELREEESNRVILEGFPVKKEHYNLFTRNCKKIHKIIHLTVDNEVASERMKKLGKDDPHFIGCSQLNKELDDFDGKKEMLAHIKKKQEIIEIDVNNHESLVVKDVISHIQPCVLLFKADDNSESLKNELLNHFADKQDFKLINVSQVIKETVSRYTPIGRKIEEYENRLEQVPNHLIIDALKPILFKERDKKYILLNYSRKASDIIEFENKLCKFQQFVYVSKNYPLQIKATEDSLEVYFKKENRLFVYDSASIEDYLINDILGNNMKFNLVYGLPGSGKTFINTHLVSKYDHYMIDLTAFIQKIKEEKAGEDGNPDDIIVTPESLNVELREHLKKVPKGKKICLDNLINPVLTELKHVEGLFNVFGSPRFFYNCVCNDLPLKDRFKEKNEITDDLSEEQLEEFVKNNEIHQKIVELIQSKAFKTVQVDTNYSKTHSASKFDKNFGKNIILVKNDYDINVDLTLTVLSVAYRTLYINVPDLIFRQFYLNNEWARRLEKSFSKKKLLNFNADKCNKLYQLSYKYNPLHFDDNVVNELILDYINQNSKENENNGNLVLLTGYLNNDLLDETEHSFNLPLFEVNKLLNLGKDIYLTIGLLNSFIQLYYNGIKVNSEEYEMRIKKEPEVKVEVKKDPLSDSQEEEEKVDEPIEEDDPDKPKWNPDEYAWSWYDGQPRNYVQILRKFTKTDPSNEKECSSNEVNDIVNNLVTNVIRNQGVLQLIKVNK